MAHSLEIAEAIQEELASKRLDPAIPPVVSFSPRIDLESRDLQSYIIPTKADREPGSRGSRVQVVSVDLRVGKRVSTERNARTRECAQLVRYVESIKSHLTHRSFEVGQQRYSFVGYDHAEYFAEDDLYNNGLFKSIVTFNYKAVDEPIDLLDTIPEEAP